MRPYFYVVASFLILLSASGLKAQTISTYAGDYSYSAISGDGGPATAAAIGSPTGIAVDVYGNVFFSDAINNAIRKIDVSGTISTIAGSAGPGGFGGDGGPATAATLFMPMGLTTDVTGAIYFADAGNFIVRKIDVSGIISTVAGTPGSHGFSGAGSPGISTTLDGADAVAIDAAGNLYIADGANKLLALNTSGIVSIFAGGISGFSGDGGPATAAACSGINGVAVDNTGNVYITESGNNVVRKITSAGIISTGAGVGGTGGAYSGDNGAATLAGLNTPSGLAIDNSGNLYIADQGNNVIRFVNAYTGIISTYAGNSTTGYSGDGGPADSAELNNPAGCAINGSHQLFIADRNNNVIRKVAPAPVIISTTSSFICAGSPATFNALTGISGDIHFNWMDNRLPFASDSFYITTDSLHNGDSITCTLTDGSGDTLGLSNTIVMSVMPSTPPTVTIALLSGDTVCSGTAVNITATGFYGGPSPTYSWYVNDTLAATATSAIFSYTPSNGDSVYCIINSGSTCVRPTTGNSNGVVISVLPTVTPAITISTASDTVCLGTTISFTSTTAGGGSHPHYTWHSSHATVGTDASTLYVLPVSGDSFSCTLTSDAACASPDTVSSNSISIYGRIPVAPTVNITATGGDSVCSGSSVIITALAVYGGPSPIYYWTINDTVVSTVNPFTYSPTTGDVVKCIMVSSLECVVADSVTSDSLVMRTISVATPIVNVEPSADTLCHGTAVTFTATGINAGATPVYEWFRNNTYYAVGTTFTLSSPVNGDSVYCVLHSTAACATPDTARSATTHLVVNPLLSPSITITASADTICAGTSVSFRARTVNGGASPTLLWYRNGAAVSSDTVYITTASSTGDVITCRLTSTATCATPDTAMSNSITMTVHPLITPSIHIFVSPGDTVCSGTSVNFTDTVTYPGTAPTYRWQKNGVNVATSATYAVVPANGDIINCVVTSSAACTATDTALSNNIIMTVNPIVTPAIDISASPAGAVCAGTSVTFSSMTLNGGPAPTYQWKVNGLPVGSGATSYSYTPANGDTVYCKLTSDGTCLTTDTARSNVVRMIVNPVLTPTVALTVSHDTVCAGMPVTYSASVGAAGTAPAYQWIKNGISVGAGLSVYTDTPSVHDSVYCRIISNAPCYTIDTVFSNAIIVHTTPLLAPGIVVTASNDTVCAGTSVTFSATTTNVGASPALHWKVNGSYVSSAASYSYIPTNGDRVKCIVVSSYSCPSPDSATSDTVTMSVNSINRPHLGLTESRDTVCAGDSVVFVAHADSAGAVPVYIWTINTTFVDTGTRFATALAVGDIVICKVLSTAVCPIPDSVADTANVFVEPHYITDTVTLTASPGTTLVYGQSVTFTAHPNHGGPSPAYQWDINGNPIPGQTNSTFTVDTLPNNANITCLVTSSDPCITNATALSDANTIVISNVGVPEVNRNNIQITALPNPSDGNFTLKGFIGYATPGTATITVTDMVGKNIFEGSCPVTSGNINFPVTLNQVANGVYLLKFSFEEEIKVLRVSINR